MATKTMTVRNACPFPIWFNAIGGPSIDELPPNETRSTSACAIWFSTRVEGPGVVFWSEEWEEKRQNYKDNAAEFSSEATDWSDGGTGAYAGSCLGLATMALIELFKIHNCEDPATHNSIYWGAKMEGVYGQSNLLVYATLDPACAATPDNPQKIWNLHLVRDTGQEVPNQVPPAPEPTPEEPAPPPPPDVVPVYAVPDLGDYSDMMFIRARAEFLGARMYAADDQDHVHTRAIDVPFDPVNFPEYWTVCPSESGGNDLKILNTKTQKWLTQFSADGGWVGLYGTGFPDARDQHWGATVVESFPTKVRLENLQTYRVLAAQATPGQPYGDVTCDPSSAPGAGSYSNVWIVETMTIDIATVPNDGAFRIMVASTGKYLTGAATGYGLSLESLRDDDLQLFRLQHLSDGSFALVLQTSSSARWLCGDSECYLTPASGSPTRNAQWTYAIDPKRAGLRLRGVMQVGDALPFLTARNGVLSMETAECTEQLFVAQLESID